MSKNEFKIGEPKVAETEEKTVSETAAPSNDAAPETKDTTGQENEPFDPKEFFASKVKGGEQPKEEVQTDPAPAETKSQMDAPAYAWAEKTGRSPEEFFALNKDFSKMESDDLIKLYYKEQGKTIGYTDEEVDYIFNEKYGEFSEMDETKISIEKKKDRAKALEFFNGLKADAGITQAGVKNDAPKQMEVPEQYKSAMEVYDLVKKQQDAATANQKLYNEALEGYYKEFDGIDINIPLKVNGKDTAMEFKYAPNKDGAERIANAQANIQTIFAEYVTEKEDGTVEFKEPKKLFDMLAKAAVVDDLVKFAFEQGGAYYTENLVEQELKRPDFKGREVGRADQSPAGRIVASR